MLCCPVAKQESQHGQAGSTSARLAAQQGCHKGPATVESNISCKDLLVPQYASICVYQQCMSGSVCRHPAYISE